MVKFTVSLLMSVTVLVWHANHCYSVLSASSRCYIQKLIAEFNRQNGRGFSGVITPHNPLLGDAELQSDDFYLPLVILWSPYQMYPSIFPPGSIKCPSCGSSTHQSYWNDGSSASKQPRLIHDMDNVVLLVSAVYRCENGHKLLAHDDSILKCFPLKSMIPFILLSRTGFTRQFVNSCTILCRRGLNFYNIETMIIERRWLMYAGQLDMLNIHKTMIGQCTGEGDFWISPVSKCPSNDIISKCFLSGFLQDEYLYLQEMTAISVGKSISFDHTFKVAANIGFLREDGTWVPQYNSLFMVMNTNGQVVTWQLTKGTSFSQIETLLKDLNQRSPTVETVYIDDCCKLRGKITSVLGSNVSVKLDLFHATQRITHTLRKKHPLVQQCMQDLQLVFREDGDRGDKRMSATPAPDIIQAKFDKFVGKWKDIQDCNGINVFTPDTLLASERLKRHISNGCISNIPPGAGTNRNERFHSHINSQFNRSRMGILLAYALLTVVIHAHNTTQNRHGRVVTRPIHASPFRGLPGSATKPIGTMPKVREQQNLVNSGHWEVHVSENMTDMELIVTIYNRSLQKYQIMKALVAMGLSRLKNCINQFIHFQPSAITASEQDELNLHQKLSEYGLRFSSMPPDGNCFFNSVAENILANLQTWSHCLTLAGVTNHDNLNVEMLSAILRKVYVKELLGEHRVDYQAFVAHTDLDYCAEANRFSQDHYYDSELGNTMPLALATALQFSLVIFHKDPNTPTMYVTPEVVTTEASAFLVYTPSGPGHYDAAIHCHKKSTPDSQEDPKPKSCRCGANKTNVSTQSCKPCSIYTTRCKCYKGSQPCTTLCGCTNCDNPYGSRPPPSHSDKRIRRKHDLQMDIPSSKRFAQERGELMSQAIWSSFESIVLTEICNSLQQENDNNIITKLYNELVQYSTSSYYLLALPPDIVFREKSLREIISKINYTAAHNISL